ncbi:MAG: glycosyltransferase [Armatimonadota bacterium]
MKLALVHDYLVQGIRGAERVVDVLHEMYPDAPVHTILYDPDRMEDRLREWDIRTSLLQDIPGALSLYKKLYFLMPVAIDYLDLSEFDLVVSSSCGWSKSAPQREGALHVSYVHSPARFLWFWADEYIDTLDAGPAAKAFVRATIPPLRDWDRRTAQRPQHLVCNSQTTRLRIREAWDRDAHVIHPPVNTEQFQPAGEPEEYYLVVCTLNPYKRVDVAVEAFNRLGLPLVVVGDGPQFDALEERAEANVRFMGKVPDGEIAGLYAHCRGFVMPQEEDFGIAPLEAQACGRPVLAYRAGGALETVIDGETGVFFNEQTPESLIDAVRCFEAASFDPDRCRENAEAFSIDTFKQKFGDYVEMCWQEHVGESRG